MTTRALVNFQLFCLHFLIFFVLRVSTGTVQYKYCRLVPVQYCTVPQVQVLYPVRYSITVPVPGTLYSQYTVVQYCTWYPIRGYEYLVLYRYGNVGTSTLVNPKHRQMHGLCCIALEVEYEKKSFMRGAPMIL
jgi:hypothetical protein